MPNSLRTSPPATPPVLTVVSAEDSLDPIDTPDLRFALEKRLSRRQMDIYNLYYREGKSQMRIAQILRYSLRTIEYEIAQIKDIVADIGIDRIEGELRTNVPLARGHDLALGEDRTLHAVVKRFESPRYRHRTAVRRDDI